MHITSLSSSHGIGDLGAEAYRFVDFLENSGQRFWQILPLNPTDLAYDNSPYHSISAFAFNPLLISLEKMTEKGWLIPGEINAPRFPVQKVDFQKVHAWKSDLLRKAFLRFREMNDRRSYQSFCESNAHWLYDYALFRALKEKHALRSWTTWPRELRDREAHALESARKSLADEIDMHQFFQYVFNEQWNSLKSYCREKKVEIIGDIPIYVDHDSVDVWTHPELFKLNQEKNPIAVSGVPPDYFSETGQLWGNPVYDWEENRSSDFDWWIRRIRHNTAFFDRIRIDHFRGLVAYWEVPSGEKTAIRGKWIDVPVYDFLNTLTQKQAPLPLIAEDLGVITPDVVQVMNHFHLPGMRVLQFGFSEDTRENPHALHNHIRESIVYTGTHDNNTTRAWFEEEASEGDKMRFVEYIGKKPHDADISWEMIRLAMMSVSQIAIIPAQDLLGLGGEHRMNLPGTAQGNWRWRLAPEGLSAEIQERLSRLGCIYGRVPGDKSSQSRE